MQQTADFGKALTIAYKTPMAAQIHQINVRYMPAQDRLVLRLNTTDKKLFRFFLTRRFTRELWQALNRFQEQDPEVEKHADPSVRSAVKSFRQENAVRKEQFGQKFDDAATEEPLGDHPVLVTGFGFVQRDEGRPNRMAFKLADGRRMTMGANQQIVVSLMKLIAQAMDQTEWNLDLGGAEEPLPESVSSETTKLH